MVVAVVEGYLKMLSGYRFKLRYLLNQVIHFYSLVFVCLTFDVAIERVAHFDGLADIVTKVFKILKLIIQVLQLLIRPPLRICDVIGIAR